MICGSGMNAGESARRSCRPVFHGPGRHRCHRWRLGPRDVGVGGGRPGGRRTRAGDVPVRVLLAYFGLDEPDAVTEAFYAGRDRRRRGGGAGAADAARASTRRATALVNGTWPTRSRRCNGARIRRLGTEAEAEPGPLAGGSPGSGRPSRHAPLRSCVSSRRWPSFPALMSAPRCSGWTASRRVITQPCPRRDRSLGRTNRANHSLAHFLTDPQLVTVRQWPEALASCQPRGYAAVSRKRQLQVARNDLERRTRSRNR